MILDPDIAEVGRKRISQVFRYLEALNQLRNPVVRQVSEQPWHFWLRNLPDHPAIRRGDFSTSSQTPAEPVVPADAKEPTSDDDYVLRVRRPITRPAPPPPEEISGWLHSGWADIDGQVEVFPSRNETDDEGETVVVPFEDDPARPALLASWKEKRAQWVINERPARDALKVFEKLYELKGRIEREGERVELVLGDGILKWNRSDGGIHHPVLLQRLQIEFDPVVPQFFLRETDHPVELYSALFRAVSDVDFRAISRCRDELEKTSYHPLGGHDTSGFLRSFVAQLSARGEFVEEGELKGWHDHPLIGRDPVIYMRTRTQGFATAIEAVIEDVQTREELPHSLLNVVGLEPLIEDAEFESARVRPDAGNDDEQILLSKPANSEQLRIAQRLGKYGEVLVQGPPGTGKTHMVGNLIGHLLAQGKSVLVTSHATKALKRVREQVIEELRSLCVSVLESDATNQAQLKNSIEAIVDRLSSADADHLEQRAGSLQRQRSEILGRLKDAQSRLRKAQGDEYREVVVAGDSFTPANAARKVASGQGEDNWIPSPVTLGEPLPLSHGELSDLYRTNVTVTAEDEMELAGLLPQPEELLTPDEFSSLVEDRRVVSEKDLRLREDLWRDPPKTLEPERIEALLVQLHRTMDLIRDCPDWKLAPTVAGRLGGPHREPWDNLLIQISEAVETCAKAGELLLAHGPQLSEEHPIDDQLRLLQEIIGHLDSGKDLSNWILLRRRDWKKLIEESRVDAGRPRLVVHFKALHAMALVQATRQDLVLRWERMMVPLGGPSKADLGNNPELACAQYSTQLAGSLDWYGESFLPLVGELGQIGFSWKTLLQEMPPDLSQYGELRRIGEVASKQLPPILASQADRLRWERIETRISALARTLTLVETGESSAIVVRRLQQSVKDLDPEGYQASFERLIDLQVRREELERRRILLGKMETSASAWAAAIRNRNAPHDLQMSPGDPERAWLWRQLHDELESRARLSLPTLQSEISDLNRQLRVVTTELIDSRAWAAQVRRTGLKQRQDLMGWLKATQRIGKGTGKWAPLLRSEARRLMSECRGAVPVWIMPLARMVENFNPGTTRFDVVIIDEASQADVTALIALYMGRQVVVVGDQEQVSPEAVGREAEPIQHLIAEHLAAIPNAALYGPQMSIYDLAQTAFGTTICLKEHFRCVPEIIQFSNQLSYEGKILPLRDPSAVKLKPHVVGYRVEGSHSSGKTNDEEAAAVASLLVAATEQPEYHGKSFGAISLVGDEQAYLIEKLLRTYLSPVEYEDRRIVCGNPAHFQGDEREVMFLSMVDAPSGGPLAMRDIPMFKKRFNVAASRAQDQMWVVYSLDPRIDLKAGDLRRRLIEHAEDPMALMRLLERGESQAESEFERLVLRRLTSDGYRVTPQWKVGHYRIDMVVEGAERRLAVECDGDRYHPLEKLDEDMARQAILERLGWTFVRIRGSEFFRDPDRAMQPVFDRLQALEIHPEGISVPTPQETGNWELKERVIRRAAQLRRIWNGEVESLPDAVTQSDEIEVDERNGRGEAVLVSVTTGVVPTVASEETNHATEGEPGDIAPVSPPSEQPFLWMPSLERQSGALAFVQLSLLDNGEEKTFEGLERSSAVEDIVALLVQKGLRVIDKRSSAGALWVFGGPELSPLMAALKSEGYRFTFAPNGGKATRNAASWWMK
jgi:very-short-patch-repair endonuclease